MNTDFSGTFPHCLGMPDTEVSLDMLETIDSKQFQDKLGIGNEEEASEELECDCREGNVASWYFPNRPP